VRVSADFCRIQAERQRAIAAAEMLENRRVIALLAAKSWQAAATLADKSASADGSSLEKLDAEITLEFAQEAEAEAKGEARFPEDVPGHSPHSQ
jgi:hypothetical protein